MINYLIIDDESMAHEIIQGYCDLLPNMHLQKNCYNAIEALDYLNDHHVDLIFLDINMPQLNGFDFLKALHAQPKVIVTSAYQEYALEGYELAIDDYLLKPFDFERFLKAIHKTFAKQSSGSSIKDASAALSPRIFLKDNKKYIQLVVADIKVLESFGNYVRVHTKKEMLSIRDKVSNILELLPPNDFIQVHKSFAVGVKHIQSIEGNQIHLEGQSIPIGKVYRLNVLNFIDK